MIESMGIQPTYNLAERDGRGYDDFGGSWVWVILILLFAGGGMWGNRGNIANDTLLSEEFIKRDIFNTNQNVSNTACETQRTVDQARFDNQACCCETQKEILENRYTTALGFKDQLYAQQQCLEQKHFHMCRIP